jgi:hypothetical protein
MKKEKCEKFEFEGQFCFESKWLITVEITNCDHGLCYHVGYCFQISKDIGIFAKLGIK